MAKRNFKNIQIQANPQFAEHFDDQYLQSGTNSKGEFLSILLENYLNPDYEGVTNVLEREKKELNEQLSQCKQDLEFYESKLNNLFEKVNGKELKIGKQTVKITDRKQLIHILVQIFKIK